MRRLIRVDIVCHTYSKMLDISRDGLFEILEQVWYIHVDKVNVVLGIHNTVDYHDA